MVEKQVIFRNPLTSKKFSLKRSGMLRNRILNRDKVIKAVRERIPDEVEKKSEEEGLQEIVKEEVKEVLKDEQKLENLLAESNQIILKIRTVFPFTFFPDQVIIDTNKVNIYHKIFFASEQINSILIKDIANVTVETNILFATLQIVDRLFTQNPYRVKFLKKKEAMLARRIIQGLMVSSYQGVDFSKIDVEQLRDKLEELGKSHGG